MWLTYTEVPNFERCSYQSRHTPPQIPPNSEGQTLLASEKEDFRIDSGIYYPGILPVQLYHGSHTPKPVQLSYGPPKYPSELCKPHEARFARPPVPHPGWDPCTSSPLVVGFQASRCRASSLACEVWALARRVQAACGEL